MTIGRTGIRLIAWASALAVVLVLIQHATANPFGVGDAPTPARVPPLNGVSGWLLAKQAGVASAMISDICAHVRF
jgi:hypothetical protein